MTHNLLRMATVIKNKVLCLDGEIRVDEFIKTMVDRKMINLYDHAISNFNANNIYRALCSTTWDSGFATIEVVAYIMKYYFGMKNDVIRDTYIDDYPLLYAINFRNVEKIHMNISRRIFNQPEYTNQNITSLKQIMCNGRLRGIILELESEGVHTIKDFQMFILKYQLKNGTVGTTKWLKCKRVIDALNEIKDGNFSYCDITKFPWNMVRSMTYTPSELAHNFLTDPSEIFVDKFMANEGIDDIDFILNNEKVLTQVILFNLKMLLDDREYIITKEKFVDDKSFTAIRDAHYGYPSAGRLQQIYAKVINTLRYTTREGKLVTNGFRLVVENHNDQIIQALFDDPSEDFFKITHLIIPGSVHATLPELYEYTKDNPLIYNVLMCGYEKGLIKTNQELRVSTTGNTEMNVPSTIEDMNLSIRTYNALYRAGINTVASLSTLTYSQLLRIRNLGRKSVKELIDKLALYGIFLKDYNYMEEKK